jgi:hypothetical protein
MDPNTVKWEEEIGHNLYFSLGRICPIAISSSYFTG